MNGLILRDMTLYILLLCGVGLDDTKPYKAVYTTEPVPQFGAKLVNQFENLLDCLMFIGKYPDADMVCMWEEGGAVRFIEWGEPDEAATK